MRDRLNGISYPWVVVALTLIVHIGVSTPSHGLAILYPFIRDEFDLSRTQVGLITSGLLGGGVVTAFLGGWMSDFWGAKRVMVALLVVMSGFMAIFSVVSSFFSLLVVGVLIGIAEGPGPPAGTRAIMDWVPRRTRALAMSTRLTGTPLGGAIAAAILPGIATAAGWRIAVLTLSVTILLLGIVFLVLYRDAPRDRSDIPKLNFGTLHALMVNKNLILTTAWAFVFAALHVVVVTYTLLYLIEELRFPVIAAGGYLAVGYLSSIAARVIWGATSDFLFRMRRIPVLGIIGITATVGLTCISLVTPGVPGIVVLILVCVLAMSTLAWQGVFITLIGELVGVSQAGTALGASSTFLRVSMIILPPLFGLLADISDSYTLGWRVAAVAALVSTLVLLTFAREAQRA